METLNVERKYVYDRLLRLFHWWISIAVSVLLITGFYAANHEPGAAQAAIWDLHIATGKCLIIGFVGRLVWGVCGPRWARWSGYWQVSEWMTILKTRKYKFNDERYGHESSAALAYLGFYCLITLMGVTGIVLAAVNHGKGPLAARIFDDLERQALPMDIHELGAWLILAFICSHVAALAFHEGKENIPLGQAMISGFQYRKQKKD